MKDHKDKGILQIDYNFLNLPKYIRFDKTFVPRFSGMFVDYNVNTRYTYRADGIRLKKIYTYGSGKTNIETSTVTDYLDGFQYEENNDGNLSIAVLKFVPTAEGYYDFEKNKYIYSYTDHLGNIRVSYFKNTNGSAEVLEENNFYPFGMKHEGYNQTAGNPAYSYQYNGKELQKETGWSDYGARMYMSDIARWVVIDPLAEQMRRYSPYTYAYNNPVSNIDPDGRKPLSWDAEQANIMTKVAPEGSLWWVYANGGSVHDGMQGGGDGIGDFFGQMKIRSGGGGGSSVTGATAINIIINFLRGDAGNLGNFVNSDFETNGWHIIDASSLEDALTKLTKYLGNNQADNIYINAHGLTSKRYLFDEEGKLIPDSKSETGYKMAWDTGFHTDKDEILGSNLQQYISDKSKLSPSKLSSIDSLIGIANYVRDGKNLIMGSCYSANDAFFGTGLSSLVKSRDIFANRDFSSNYVVTGKGIIPFNNFINYNQTSKGEYKNGWVWYRDGSAIQTNFNIIMTKYGVKTLK
jgi:RHS repeat-associated protein